MRYFSVLIFTLFISSCGGGSKPNLPQHNAEPVDRESCVSNFVDMDVVLKLLKTSLMNVSRVDVYLLPVSAKEQALIELSFNLSNELTRIYGEKTVEGLFQNALLNNIVSDFFWGRNWKFKERDYCLSQKVGL